MAKRRTAKEEEPESFDKILKDLQVIVEQLEAPDLPLEQSLVAFEKGVALSRRGQEILDAAEKRVEMLLQDGSTETIEFDSNKR
jgi:exodeoxyribonuclease VII small subunit